MGNIKVKDLTDTGSVTVDNEIMVLTNATNNTVQNITVNNLLTSVISSDANNALQKGNDNKLYTADTDTKIGNLSNLDTTDKSSVVNAINELSTIIDPTLQYATMNNSKALETGAISTDTTIMADVIKYSQSTFDPYKYSYIGSSTFAIDDGVASNFNSTNYATTPLIDVSNTSFTVYLGKVNSNTASISQAILTETNTSAFYVVLAGSVKVFRLQVGGSSTYAPITLTDNTDYYVKLVYTAPDLYLCVSTDNKNWTNSTPVSVINPLSNIQLKIGANTDNTLFMTGSYDLKQFKVKTDAGLTLFSCNKTGVDQYGEYTTTSTAPTITADGIASDFSQTKLVQFDYNLTTDYNTLEIDLGEITLARTGKSQWFFKATETDNGISKGFVIMIYTNNRSRWFAGSGGSNYDIESAKQGNITYAANQRIHFKLVFNGTRYTLYSSINGGAWQVDSYSDSTLKINFNTTVLLGGDGASSNVVSGTYNLNGISIKKDGISDYLLEFIPYTLSKTGSKVVDSVYRDRVTAVYNALGYAPYYTLSDTDFTLPMGELYGMIDPNRFDGQWIWKGNLISSTTAVGTTAIDLSSLLPNDEYDYLCVFRNYISRQDNSNVNTTITFTVDGNIVFFNGIQGGATSNDTTGIASQFVALIGASRSMNLDISTHSLYSQTTTIDMYRRIGTNK